ncbi:MAG: cob(I)yrinic acid a,c-diamide adenosyltransferase [Candidatus Xenobia bacterium]
MRINRVVTKTGDQGETALIGGTRVGKDSLRISACGDVDELNSCLGLAAAWIKDDSIRDLLLPIQNRLFTVGADVNSPAAVRVPRVTSEHVSELEQVMEGLMDELPPLEEFILPGGGPGGAALHLARTVARRAERTVVALSRAEETNAQALIYLNRLSDFLFVLARVANKRAGEGETLANFSERKKSVD